jgi:hypothetical protein
MIVYPETLMGGMIELGIATVLIILGMVIFCSTIVSRPPSWMIVTSMLIDS